MFQMKHPLRKYTRLLICNITQVAEVLKNMAHHFKPFTSIMPGQDYLIFWVRHAT